MLRKAWTLAKLVSLSLLLAAAAASAQDYKIRAKIDLVVVPVTVRGPGDKLITGLTKDDFVILEAGQKQTISNFTLDPVPLAVAVVVDTGLAGGSLSKVQKTFPALTGAFSEFDEVAVYRYDKFVTQVLEFSENDESLRSAMNMLRDVKVDRSVRLEAALPRGPFSNVGPIINGAPVILPGQLGIPVTGPPKFPTVLNDAIFAAAEDLSKRERSRRKIVLVISDGDTTGSDHSFDETAQLLLERGIQVYAVALDQPFPYNKFSVLHDYAKTTGGDVYFVDSTKSIERSYSTATEEARNQYVLGYVSSNEPTGPGPVFREIDVQVVGRDLKTLYRKGYYQYP